MVNQAEQNAGDTTRSPIVAFNIAGIVFAFLGIGIIGANLPNEVPLRWPIASLIVSAVCTLVAIFLLSRRRLDWKLFFSIIRWMQIVTLIFAGMAIYIFLYDGTPGRVMWIMGGVQLLAAVNLPMLIAFSVARHSKVGDD